MTSDSGIPKPADHNRTITIGNYELAPGGHLSKEIKGPMGENQYFSFLVIDVDPDAGELELYSVSDQRRRVVSADDLTNAIGVDTYVITSGLDDAEDADGFSDSDS